MTAAFELIPAEPTDSELLRRVAARDGDGQAARDAQALFYTRHVRYLYAVVLKRCARPFALSHAELEDLVQDTFFRAFERAATFQDADSSDPERRRRRTRAWLGSIAQRLLADSFKHNLETPASTYLEALPTEEQEDDGPISSPAARLLRQALASLSEREQDVLRVVALYHRVGETHQRLPNEVSAQLAARWNTSSDNIRAIRSRALKKVKTFIERRGLHAVEDS